MNQDVDKAQAASASHAMGDAVDLPAEDPIVLTHQKKALLLKLSELRAELDEKTSSITLYEGRQRLAEQVIITIESIWNAWETKVKLLCNVVTPPQSNQIAVSAPGAVKQESSLVATTFPPKFLPISWDDEEPARVEVEKQLQAMERSAIDTLDMFVRSIPTYVAAVEQAVISYKSTTGSSSDHMEVEGQEPNNVMEHYKEIMDAIGGYNARISEVLTGVPKLVAENTKLNERLAALQKTHAEAVSNLEEAQEASRRLRVKLTDAKKALDRAIDATKHANIQPVKIEGQSGDVKSTDIVLKSTPAEESAQIQELNDTVKKLRDELNKKTTEVGNQMKEIVDIKSLYARPQENVVDELRTKHRDILTQLSSLQTKISQSIKAPLEGSAKRLDSAELVAERDKRHKCEIVLKSVMEEVKNLRKDLLAVKFKKESEAMFQQLYEELKKRCIELEATNAGLIKLHTLLRLPTQDDTSLELVYKGDVHAVHGMVSRTKYDQAVKELNMFKSDTEVKLKKLQAYDRDLNSSSSNPQVECIRAKGQVAELDARCSSLSAENTTLQNTLNTLSNEMESIAHAYDELNAQNVRLLTGYHEKEDIIAQITADRMRDRTLQDLQKETKRVVDGELDKLKIKVDSDRQLIMALEEEKLRHANQVNSWNEAYTALNAQFEQLKAVLMAKESELNLMKGEAAQSSAMAKVARDKFNEKINDFEEFVHVREELEAEVVRLRKKVAKVSRSDIKYEGNDRTAFLEDVNRSLEAKLCCSVCNDRHIDCIITKCYHCFCMQCIDDMIKSRNRKCPTCKVLFLKTDVHELYL